MKKFSLLVAGLMALVLQVQAGQPTYQTTTGTGPVDPPAPAVASCAYGTARAELDINNVRTLLFDGGDMWWDLICCARYEVPKVDDPGGIKRHSMYASSIWVTGKEQGTNNIYVMAQTYRSAGNFSFWPGPIDNVTAFTTNARCLVWDKMFKINRNDVEDFVARYAAGAITSPNDLPVSVLRWPGRNNPYLPSQQGYEGIELNYNLARFYDQHGDGVYDPMDGDYPLLPGHEGASSGADQCVFWVMNDVGSGKKFSNSTSNARPIGMEIQTEAFGYATSDYTNDMTFYRQKLTNKGTTILADCYFGQWADPDLGNANDDYVQFNVPRGLAICYNGDDNDEGVQGYGLNPPSIAIDFFKGPVADPHDGVDNDKDCLVDEDGELIIASSFVYYNNSTDAKIGDPSYAIDYANFQRSLWKDNTPMTYDGGNGTTPVGQTSPRGIVNVQPTHFLFPGSSDQTIGWSTGGNCQAPQPGLPIWSEVTAGNAKGDRRMLTNAGPFTLRPGAVNELTIGVVWARTTSGGATGSFNKLLAADDAAQKLFDNDFKILDGPDAPDVEITELDQNLVFTIIPHHSTTSNGTTETYQEKDFNARLTDPYYRFQGYLVYQLADASVGFGDLDNPDKAKLLADVSSDVKDGIGAIINEEFSDDLGGITQVLKVRGQDKGLLHTFAINKDLFSTTGDGSLINFHKYFFTVLAYGYNGDSAQQIKYIQGRQNRNKYEAIPHKTAPESNGTVIRSTFNQSLEITRLQGFGNGGNVFDSLNKADEDEIVAGPDYAKMPIRYTNGKAPVSVTIYNPKKVVAADLKLRLYGRVSYVGDAGIFNVGDTLVSRWDSLPSASMRSLIKDPILVQKPGLAVIVGKRLRLGTENTIDLEVQMLNDAVGGRFTAVLNSIDISTAKKAFLAYIYQKEPFYKKGNPAQTAMATEFAAADFWRLYNSQEQLLDTSSRGLSALRDQISPKVGVLISLNNVYDPGTFDNISPINGYEDGAINFGTRGQDWFETIGASKVLTDTAGGYQWFRNSGFFIETPNPTQGIIDLAGNLRLELGGSFAPTWWTDDYTSDRRTSGASMPAVPSNIINYVVKTSVQRIHNVDIVLTNDKSLWTRCVVVQGDSILPNGTIAYAQRFNKSRLASVDNNYQPTGELSPNPGTGASHGMSYFPGYAIDLDRGMRLNMAFLESQVSDPLNGNNLKWEPSTTAADRFGAKNYMYVFASKYDKGVNNERRLDSIAQIGAGVRTKVLANFWMDAIWVGRVARLEGKQLLSSKARISLRIDRSFTSYPDTGGVNGTPTYAFSTDGLQPIVASDSAAKSALDLIRVVPNPYYAYSSFEQSQIDNRVRITNLPTKFRLSIFTLSGSLIRQYTVDNSTEGGNDPTTNRNLTLNKTTFLDWDLKSQTGLPVASGVYLMHIDAYGLGVKTVKWFGVMRPTDLDAIQQN